MSLSVSAGSKQDTILFAFKMLSRNKLKLVFMLCIWSFMIVGLVKLLRQSVTVQMQPHAKVSVRTLLQKDMQFSEPTTIAITADPELQHAAHIDNNRNDIGKYLIEILHNLDYCYKMF